MTIALAMSAFLMAFGCRPDFTPLPPQDSLTYQSILDWTRENDMPGAILLVQTPRDRFASAVGWADARNRIAMRADHAFRVASVTKMFVGIVAAQLCTEGRLDADLPITRYLPASITDHIRNSERITVRQLVRHTSGIYSVDDNFWYQIQWLIVDPHGDWSPSRELQFVYDKAPYFPPGEGFHYSNTNFILLGLIIDRVTGHHHSVEIRQRILEPLKLTGTYYEGYEPPRGQRAHGYERIFGVWVDADHWPAPTGGDAGIVSTASDLAVFVRAVTGQNGFLDDATRKLIKSQPSTSPTNKPWYPILHYDFGITADRGAGRDVPVSKAPWFFGHGGAMLGCKCFALHEPREDITIVFFASSMQADPLDLHRIDRFEAILKQGLLGLATKK